MSLQGTPHADQELRGTVNMLRLLVINAYDIAVKNGFDGTEEEWLDSLKMSKEEIGEAVNAYLDENPVAIDTTLSVSGQAADAKVTGDAFKVADAANKEAKADAANAANAAAAAQNTANTAVTNAANAQTAADGKLPLTGGDMTGWIDFGQETRGIVWTTANGTKFSVRPHAEGNLFQITRTEPNGDEYGALNIHVNGIVDVHRMNDGAERLHNTMVVSAGTDVGSLSLGAGTIVMVRK